MITNANDTSMLERIIRAAIAHRWLVLLLVLASSALGVWSYRQLPIDAVPDITNVQVQINTEAPGYSPLEAEQRLTYPIETALAGLARLDYTRSISRYGLSQVTAVFEDGTDGRRAAAVGEGSAAARHRAEPRAGGHRAR
jgi:heavy metal efflux system protein